MMDHGQNGLPNKNFLNKIRSHSMKYIYPLSLLIIELLVWRLLWQAQFLPYDENYGSLLGAFFLSLLTTMGLVVIWFKWKQLLINHRYETILFLIVASPVSVFLTAMNYSFIFNAVLKN